MSDLNVIKQMLSFKEALSYLDVSKSYLYKITSNRKINFTKPNNGKIYFRKSDLDNWMLQNEVPSITAHEEQVFNYLKKRSNGND